MQNIKEYLINEAVGEMPQTSEIYDNVNALLYAIKKWHNAGVKSAGKNSPFVKSFEKGIETFIKDCVINMDYLQDDIDELLDTYSSIQGFKKITKDDDWGKIQDVFVNFVLKK